MQRVAILLALWCGVALANKVVEYEMINVYTDGESGYACIRIPALLLTSNGTLLAFAEARKYSCDDHGWVDMVVKRSFDLGETWGPLQIVFTNSTGSSTDKLGWVTISNAAPVQDNVTGLVLLPMCRNNLEVYLSTSADDGATWSVARKIEGVTHDDWLWVGTGPPGSIQLSSGRLLVPCYHGYLLGIFDGDITQSHIMYSDDHGETWQLGAYIDSFWHTNECQATQLPSGDVFINMRSLDGYRLTAVSSDEGLSFSKPVPQHNLTEDLLGCEGSTMYHAATDRILFSNPSVPINQGYRYNISLHTSADLGATWDFWGTLWPYAGGYTSLATMPDQSVSVIFERANTTKLIQEPLFLTYIKSFYP